MTGILDMIAVAIVAAFIVIGVMQGFVRSVVRVVGGVVSLVVAYFLSAPVSELIAAGATDLPPLAWRALSFVGIFFAASILLRLLGGLISKILSWIPVVKQLNGVLGGVLGAIEGVLAVVILTAAFQMAAIVSGDGALITLEMMQETWFVSKMMWLPF